MCFVGLHGFCWFSRFLLIFMVLIDFHLLVFTVFCGFSCILLVFMFLLVFMVSVAVHGFCCL